MTEPLRRFLTAATKTERKTEEEGGVFVRLQVNETKKKEDGEIKAALTDCVWCLRAQVVDWLGLPSVPP